MNTVNTLKRPSKSEENQDGPGYKAPAIHKAFELVRTVVQSRQGLGIIDLAQQLGYSKSTTHGLVHALIREGVLARGPGGRKLSLGPTIAELAFTNWNHNWVNEQVQPILNAIRDQINETVIMGVRIRNRVLLIATAEAAKFLKISADVGSTIPLMGGAVGKVFLAQEDHFRSAQLVEEYGLRRYTEHSIIDPEEYLAELNKVRARGYALDIEEYLQGIRAVAVALDNSRGLPAAVWAVGISANMGSEKMAHMAEILVEKAKSLRTILDEGPAHIEDEAQAV